MTENIEPEFSAIRTFPRYGDIYDINLDPAIGAETGKRRPALVVSNDISNEFSQTVTILPITSQLAKKQYPFEVFVPENTAGLMADSRIKANQIRTVDKHRIASYIGTLPAEYLPKVGKALKIHLNIK